MVVRIGLLFITFCLLLGQSAQAVGIGVKPKEINLSVRVNKEVETEILIINVADEPAMYQVYSDSLGGIISLSPSDFQLEPNGNQIIKILVKVKKPGLFATNISAVARPLGGGGLVAGSGVKIPITIDATGVPFWWVILGIIAACLLVIFVVILVYKKKQKSNP